MSCVHENFAASVEIGRLLANDDVDPSSLPDSFAVDVRAHCLGCGRNLLFEGPIGIAVGPGAPAMVSFDGQELHAAAHIEENRSPRIMARLSV